MSDPLVMARYVRWLGGGQVHLVEHGAHCKEALQLVGIKHYVDLTLISCSVFTGIRNEDELINFLDCQGMVEKDVMVVMTVELYTLAKGVRAGVASKSELLYINEFVHMLCLINLGTYTMSIFLCLRLRECLS